MLRLFTKKQGARLASRQIIQQYPRRFIVTGNKIGSPENKADQDGERKGNTHDDHLWNRVEKLDDRLSNMNKEHNDFKIDINNTLGLFKVDVNKSLTELKVAIERGFRESRAELQKTRTETLTEIEKFRAQSDKMHWEVALLLTGSGLVVAFIVEEYLRANLSFQKKPPPPAANPVSPPAADHVPPPAANPLPPPAETPTSRS